MNLPINFTQAITKILQILSTKPRAIGYETISLNDSNVHSLTVPDNARSAVICVANLAADTVNSICVAYGRYDGALPTATDALRYYHMQTIIVDSYANLVDAKFLISAATAQCSLKVQYYS